jgi:hypothetical protein
VQAASERFRPPSLATVVGLVFGAWGLITALQPLKDNSFLTHLATGRYILDHGIPHRDIYSFTARHEPWVVQSWLASVIFGLSDRWWGGQGIRVVLAVVTVALALLVWRLTRPAGALIGRLIAAGLVVGVGAGQWVERPLLFGLLLLAVVLLVAEDDRIDLRWLIPVMWLWVNLHGSFPLGLVALAVLAIGRRLDDGVWGRERPAFMWALLGTALGAINPLGPKLLVFPVHLLGRNDVLQNVIEWQAPKFMSSSERIFLLELVCAIVVLARRPTWRAALPLAVFTAAALLGSRNVPVTSLVLLPGLAYGLHDLGTISGDERRPLNTAALAAVVALGVLIGVSGFQKEPYDLIAYPVDAAAWMQSHGIGPARTRVVERDYAGNYLEAIYGTRSHVFIDDRVDMYPPAVSEDFATLLHGTPGWDGVLDRYDAQVVLWEARQPLGQLLAESPHWRLVYVDEKWVVACRVDAGGQLVRACRGV